MESEDGGEGGDGSGTAASRHLDASLTVSFPAQGGGNASTTKPLDDTITFPTLHTISTPLSNNALNTQQLTLFVASDGTGLPLGVATHNSTPDGTVDKQSLQIVPHNAFLPITNSESTVPQGGSNSEQQNMADGIQNAEHMDMSGNEGDLGSSSMAVVADGLGLSASNLIDSPVVSAVLTTHDILQQGTETIDDQVMQVWPLLKNN